MRRIKKLNKQTSKKSKLTTRMLRDLKPYGILSGAPSLPGNVTSVEQNKPTLTMPRKLPLSKHPIAKHVDRIRELVHGALADAGISGLSLSAIHFDVSDSCSDPCPEGQHRKMVCRTMPDGSQVCSCECVPI